MSLWETRRRKYMRMFKPKTTMWDRQFWQGAWREKRRMIILRDGFCLFCHGAPDNDSGWFRKLDVHHIDGNRNNQSDANLITLCKRHHKESQRKPFLVCQDCGKYKLEYVAGLWICESATPISQDYENEEFIVRLC